MPTTSMWSHVAALREMAAEHYEARHNIEGYVLPNGKTLFSLAEGRLVESRLRRHPAGDPCDMSFAVQAMSAKYLADRRAELLTPASSASRTRSTTPSPRKSSPRSASPLIRSPTSRKSILAFKLCKAKTAPAFAGRCL